MYFESPIGIIKLSANEQALLSLYFVDQKSGDEDVKQPVLLKTKQQLEEYFAGKRKTFDLPLQPVGTFFQRRVWSALQKVPFGKTASYGEIAKESGNPKAMRAVGLANGRNPISIIIPCHRIIGADGKLVGYGGGLWRKEWLLQHERGA